MRLTIPHNYDFGADRARVGRHLVHPASWDAVRDSEGAFGLPLERAEWEAKAAEGGVIARATDIASVARSTGVRRLCSYGVGTALLELQLSRIAPELELVCTDYAPKTVERLRELFPEAEVRRHDLRTDEPLAADLHLLHRIDTEFRNSELRRVLGRFHDPVLLVPAHLLGLRLLAQEISMRLFHRRTTRAGWVRTEAALRELWANTHISRELTVGGAPGFLLERRSGG